MLLRSGVVLVLAVLLAGCAEPAPDQRPDPSEGRTFDPLPCETLTAPGPSGNAPRFSVFERPVEELAADLAAALGDELLPDEREPEGLAGSPTRTWQTREGQVEYFAASDGGFASLRYWGERHWTPLDGSRVVDDYRRVLEAIGLPAQRLSPPEMRTSEDQDQTRLDGQFRQTFGGYELAWDMPPEADERESGELVHITATGIPARIDFWVLRDHQESRDRSQFTLHRLADLSDARAEFPKSEAMRRAYSHAWCTLQAQGHDEVLDTLRASDQAGYALVHESLAYTFGLSYALEPTCAGQRFLPVFVDARTGSILGDRGGQSGCIE